MLFGSRCWKTNENRYELMERQMSELKITCSRFAQEVDDLKRTSEMLFFILDSVPAYIVCKDIEMRHIFVNQHVARETGITKAKWVGKKISELFLDGPELYYEIDRGDEEILRSGRSKRRVLYKTETSSGTRWRQMDKIVVKDRSGNNIGIVGLYIDATRFKLAEERVRELYKREKGLHRKLEKQSREKAEFDRALAHELKTPLTPILIASEILLSELPEGRHLDLARQIHHGITSLNSRIDELLDLARGGIGTLKLECHLLQPGTIIQEIGTYMAPQASWNGLAFNIDIASSLPVVWADKQRLWQIITNLLNNAFKYTPSKGKVTLRGRRSDVGDLLVEVQDTGCGITKEQQEHIFELYHQVQFGRERLSGLGIGLALCKLFVKLHQGNIWVNSIPGKGSTFSFTIPRYSDNKSLSTEV